MRQMNETILDKTLIAYADCHGNEPFEKTSYRRNLSYCAPGSVDRADAVEIMRQAVEHGYNEFEADLLNQLPDGCRITLARENSVCVYVDGNVPEIPEMNADEWHYYPDLNRTRIWWD